MQLSPDQRYGIGRSPANQIVLHDPRASRQHAEIRARGDHFIIVDGYFHEGELRRSVNRVFVNDAPVLDKLLISGDEIKIGSSRLIFENPAVPTAEVKFDDRPLGQQTKLLMLSASDVINSARGGISATSSNELEDLRRKAKILDLLYEMSKTLSAQFDLPKIFDKATAVIFEVTPADRVVALLTDEKNVNEKDADLHPIAMKARTVELTEYTQKLTVSRTITRKVVTEGAALLSQDARHDSAFSEAHSIVSQGVRSTICAPLITESGVHGALYADRLDPFAKFTADDLALISTIAAQTAVVVEMVRAHERLAREEVARANYGRFLPEYVVRQILENPDSFQLGGTNQTVTVLFADVRGFTRMSEHAPPEKVVQILNRYFSLMTEIIFAHGGTLDKFIGDGLMALFGAPTASADDAVNAVKTAMEMQRQLHKLNDDLQRDGFDRLSIGIGLHTGEAVVGYIGSEKRSEYTAIGDTVNLSARLESNARPGQILMSNATAEAVGANQFPLLAKPPMTVKNRVQPVPLFEVQWQQL